jgi:phosphoenolpyruvate carboxykinase (GTP)
MAMLPFCGYHMGDYFRHWLNMGKKIAAPPKIFSVNWFRLNDKGEFLWPGFGENIRVLKWILDRVHDGVDARETPLGRVPHIKDLGMRGLDIPNEQLEELFKVNPQEWQQEVADIEKLLTEFGDRLPQEMWEEFNTMKAKLG